MFNQYPYTDGYELNTDWIIAKIKDVEKSEANAKQSAEDSDTARQGAVDAQEAAERAQGLAEDAQGAAERAQGLAEDARDDAQGYAGDAAQTVQDTLDQINLLQSRVDNIIPDGTQTAGNTELLDIRVAADGFIYDSAGNAVRGQVNDLYQNIVDITEYTRNLFDTKNVKIGIAQNGSSNADRATVFLPIEGGETYVISTNSISNFDAVFWYQKVAENVPASISNGAVSNGVIITADVTATVLAIQFNKASIAESDFSALKMQVEKNVLPTEYIPHQIAVDYTAREELDNFSNLTGITRNLFTDAIIGRAANTSVNADRATAYIPVTAGEDYTISFDSISSFDAVYWYQKASVDSISSVSEGVVSNGLTLTIANGVSFLAIQFNKATVSKSDIDAALMQVEESDSSTKYIPHITAIDYVARDAIESGGTYCDYIKSREITTFNKILCAGDSLTAGTFNHNEGGPTVFEVYPKYSFPTYITKLTGVQTVNKGIGGKTSDEWYALEAADDLSGFDCAIMQFGVNDYLRYGGWTAASVQGFTDIINKLKTENNNIFIFVATIIPSIAYSGAQADAVSAGIRSLVSSLNDSHVILLDLAKYGHTIDPAYNCGHLSALGYQRLAQDYVNGISYYMVNNKMLFRQVQFVGTTYSYSP